MGVAALGLGGWIWQMQRELSDLRVAVQEDRERVAVEERRVSEIKVEFSSLQSEIKKGDAAAASAGNLVLAQTSAASPTGEDVRDPKVSDEAARRAEAAKLVTEKIHLNQQYAMLFRKLARDFKISPDQLDKLKFLLVDRQQGFNDAVTLARAQGITMKNPDVFKPLVLESALALDAQIEQLLGKEAYGKFLEYEQTMSSSRVVNQVQQYLRGSPDQLSEAQYTNLVNLLHSNMPKNTSYGDNIGKALADYEAPVNRPIITAAKAFLSPQQIAALELYQRQRAAERWITKTLKDLQAAPAKTGSGS